MVLDFPSMSCIQKARPISVNFGPDPGLWGLQMTFDTKSIETKKEGF